VLIHGKECSSIHSSKVTGVLKPLGLTASTEQSI
jgi:hypothetical protein